MDSQLRRNERSLERAPHLDRPAGPGRLQEALLATTRGNGKPWRGQVRSEVEALWCVRKGRDEPHPVGGILREGSLNEEESPECATEPSKQGVSAHESLLSTWPRTMAR